MALVATPGSYPACWLAGDLAVNDKKALCFGSSSGGYGALTTAKKVSGALRLSLVHVCMCVFVCIHFADVGHGCNIVTVE